LAGLEKQKALYAATVARLSSASETTVVLVARADTASLREANRTRLELTDLGIGNQTLVINGLFCGDTAGDAIAAPWRRAPLPPLKPCHQNWPTYRKHASLPATWHGGAGCPARDGTPGNSDATNQHRYAGNRATTQLRGLVEDIAASGHGVIMTMGKGGVGKTTVAAAIAVALAKKATRWCSPPPTRPPTPQPPLMVSCPDWR
jgi:arsenite-transporting ATPase